MGDAAAEGTPAERGRPRFGAGGRRRAGVAMGSAVVLAAIWAAALTVRALRATPVDALDAAWARDIVVIRYPATVNVANGLAAIGGAPGSIVVSVVVALVIFWRRGLPAALVFGALSLLSEANVTAMKAVDLRIGPQGQLFEGLGSFPSGHTANAAVLAVTAAVLLDRRGVRVLGVAWVAVMVMSRTLLAAHWLTDTLAGAACGGAAAALVWSIAWPLRSRRRRGPRRD